MRLFRKQRPCAEFCAGTIQGIVDNQKLLGHVSDAFSVSIKVMNGISLVPPHSYVMTCEHGQSFLVRETTPRRARGGE